MHYVVVNSRVIFCIEFIIHAWSTSYAWVSQRVTKIVQYRKPDP